MPRRVWKTLGIFLVLLFLCSCTFDSLRTSDKNLGHELKKGSLKEEEIKKEEVQKFEINILAMGDMIFHRPLNAAAKIEDSYDYTPFFAYIKDDIEGADFALANFEGSINSERPMGKFPLFNFPKESPQSLKNVGFDLLSTSNNHCLDTGVEGIKETIRTINACGLKSVGTYLNDKRVDKIIEVNGIKIGFLAYTDLLNGMDSLISGQEFLVDTFKRDFEGDIKKLRERTDFVIVMPHWGNEYQYIGNQRQRELKDKIFGAGADIILGSHPHVVQNYEDYYINGERKFVIYSMGNALSNQREEIIGKKAVDTGLIVKIKISKSSGDERAKLESFELIPSLVRKERIYEKDTYRIYKLKDLLEGGKFFESLDDNTKNLARDRYEFVEKTINYKEAANE
ncbi:CapA family protein [Peptoniphilus raoultii]|uniref:CapA family protein n=1 Tax=Peptoniphilus raoultii TaxID=1776387 RepID=UPI0008DA66B4|nr:CapA family protein [Peptoniphilus raoultii]